MSSTPNPRRHSRRLQRSLGIYKILPQSPKVHYPVDSQHPLETEDNIERLESLADGVTQLEVNMKGLSRIHTAISAGFNEPFAGFLYGLLITMFCNNFPGCPTKEQIGAIQRAQTVHSRVRLLKERVQMAKLENNRLHSEINHRNAQRGRERANVDLFRTPISRVARPSIVVPKQPILAAQRQQSLKRKVTVAHDDTFSTTESFVETPGSSSSRIPLARTPAGGPNLNQPPRYMRGLFDKTGSSNVARQTISKPKPASQQGSRPARVTKASRPPFR